MKVVIDSSLFACRCSLLQNISVIAAEDEGVSLSSGWKILLLMLLQMIRHIATKAAML